MIKSQLVYRPRIRIKFDRHQVQAQSRKTECCFVDVKIDDLVIEDLPEGICVRPFSSHTPMRHDQFAECRQQENSATSGRIKDP